jgi:hypothetical protein
MLLLMARAIKSVGPPAEKGTTRRTGLLGKSAGVWACANTPKLLITPSANTRAKQRQPGLALDKKIMALSPLIC